MQATYVPGAPVIIRNCGWIARRAGFGDNCGSRRTVDGLSELINGKCMRFFTQWENHSCTIRLRNPVQAFKRNRQCTFIADDVGLGNTFETGADAVAVGSIVPPWAACDDKWHDATLNLQTLPDDYLLRTCYIAAYRDRIPNVPRVKEGKRWKRIVTKYYWVMAGSIIGADAKWTLASTIMRNGAAHIDLIGTYIFKKSNFLLADPACYLLVPNTRGQLHLHARVSTSLTNRYAALLQSSWQSDLFQRHCAARAFIAVLPQDFFLSLAAEWQCHSALRTDDARRRNLVEVEFFVAQALGLTLEELLVIAPDHALIRSRDVLRQSQSHRLNALQRFRPRWSDRKSRQEGPQRRRQLRHRYFRQKITQDLFWLGRNPMPTERQKNQSLVEQHPPRWATGANNAMHSPILSARLEGGSLRGLGDF